MLIQKKLWLHGGHNGQAYATTEYPTAMVAAAAYDKKHNKLFFTPMRIWRITLA